MLLDGDRTSGMDVRNANVTAAKLAIANIVKTSLRSCRIGQDAC